MPLKVTVCGAAGGIGQPLALLLKEKLPAGSHLSLYDIVHVKGVGADLSHVCTAVNVTSHLGDAELGDALKDADVVVIPAGVPRKPGMTRDDLFNINAGIVRTLVENIAKQCPKALVAIITNPVNSTVPIAAEVLKKAGVYDKKRLFGVTTLDIVRANTFVAEAKGLDVSKLNVRVVGGHSGNTILPLLSQVPGATWSAEEQQKMTVKIQEAGTEVVNAKAGAGSATLSMAYAGAKFVSSLVRGLQGESNVVECTYVNVDAADGEPSFFAHPVVLGKNGVEQILPLGSMNEFEQKAYNELKATVVANIKTGVDFVHNPPAKK